MMIIHNVSDRRQRQWIGSWEAEPLDVAALTLADVGRTVIYRDHGRAEAGTLTSWNSKMVWARYSTGDTAVASHPDNLCIAMRALDGPDGEANR